jgi:hypothetical protein
MVFEGERHDRYIVHVYHGGALVDELAAGLDAVAQEPEVAARDAELPKYECEADNREYDHVASRFIVTQFKRPLAGKELRNLALTCKALYKLLFVDDAYILGLAQAKHIQQRLLAPVPAPLEIDTYKNVSWRVSFETDLCVLVLYRAEIIGPAVRRVASDFENDRKQIKKLSEGKAAPQVASTRYHGNEYRMW